MRSLFVVFAIWLAPQGGILPGVGAASHPNSAFVPKSSIVQQQEAEPNLPSMTSSNIYPAGGGAKKKIAVVADVPWWKTLLSKEKLPWLVCSALSLYYLAISISKEQSLGTLEADPKNPYYIQGFCVTGLAADGTCDPLSGNSHQFAFGIDVIYTILALALPFTGLTKSPKSSTLTFYSIVLAFIIGFHGILHEQFSVNRCDLSGGAEKFEEYYILYIAALMLVDVFGFSSIPSWDNGFVIGITTSAALTALTFYLTLKENKSIAAFFMMSQVVVSLTGLLIPDTDKMTWQLGWSFVLPILVSLVEFSDCNLLVAYGGHAWYDNFLHLAFLVSLLTSTFGNKGDDEKKKK
jgi:hypothetical protein